MAKPTYTFKDGSKIKYTGKRDVKAVWGFENEKGMMFGGFSIDAKAALATAKKNFKIYTDGNHKLVANSIEVFELNE